jgi:hypothetical protein
MAGTHPKTCQLLAVPAMRLTSSLGRDGDSGTFTSTAEASRTVKRL